MMALAPADEALMEAAYAAFLSERTYGTIHREAFAAGYAAALQAQRADIETAQRSRAKLEAEHQRSEETLFRCEEECRRLCRELAELRAKVAQLSEPVEA